MNDACISIVSGVDPAFAHNDSDVRETSVEKERNDIAHLKDLWESIARHWTSGTPELRASPRKVSFKIQNAPMVDVGIGMHGSPDPSRWIGIEMCRHIFMHELLQVESQAIPPGSNDDIRTDSRASRNVAARILQLLPRWVVSRGYTQLRSSSYGKCPSMS